MAKSFSIPIFFIAGIFFSISSFGQLKWTNVDSLFQPLPASVHIFFTDNSVDTSPFRAYYVIADLKDKELDFTVDTSHNRRLTPTAFYKKNDNPLVVVNTTFFSFETNRSLNVVIKDKKLLAYNIHTINGRGKDTFTYRHPFGSALGINKDREADVAWIFTDSSHTRAYASQFPIKVIKDSTSNFGYDYAKYKSSIYIPNNEKSLRSLAKWKMRTAVGGGPVLLQNGQINITNDEEMKFGGKAINDKHPRTAMGYTKDNKLIILVIEGRNKKAAGATLPQEAQIFKDLGCEEALNLDGGGSSCMLVNGKETIKISDPTGQRPVPAVFIIRKK